MVFSSIPTYLDPASWQQQQPTTTTGVSRSSQILPPPLPPPPPPQQPPPPHGGNGSGSIRPGSMTERARLANIPMPEAAMKCPRCESTNTKFCYFNNYSLSQPRHFCKTCRRYWTRGGAMRSVPVGGGCRRNKRTKSSSSNNITTSNTTSSKSHDSTSSTSNMGPSSSIGSMIATFNSGLITGHDHMLGLGASFPPLRSMVPLHHQLNEFNNTENLGLSYGAISSPLGRSSGHDMSTFHVGCGSGGASLLSGLDQWRFPAATQLPLLGGLDISLLPSSSGLYPFEQAGIEQASYGGVVGTGQIRPKIFSSSSSFSGLVSAATTQLASVKVEDNNELSRQFLGNDQFWVATTGTTTSSWSDLANNCSSSSTNNAL